jgi:predicted O-methyltransferase YrrM
MDGSVPGVKTPGLVLLSLRDKSRASLRDGSFIDQFQAMNCLATFIQPLRDEAVSSGPSSSSICCLRDFGVLSRQLTGTREMNEDCQDRWTAVDEYLTDLLIPSDPVLEAALEDSDTAGLPAISVTPTQGKLLWLFARLVGAHKVLELGTLGAYSTIWLARALPKDGRLITMEASPEHAKVATANLQRAALSDRVELRVGRGLDLLPVLATEGIAPFDLIFIDADKVNTADYFIWALKLSRPGTLIITDNVIRKGAVADAKSKDASVVGMRRFFELLGKENGFSATAIQTVGSKGHDGFAMAIVNGQHA